MPLERSVVVPAPAHRSPRRWLPLAIITTGLAITTSAAAILVSATAPSPVVRDLGVHTRTSHRLVPSGRLCPTVEQDAAPRDYIDPWGTQLRITCVPMRYGGRDHDWAMTRGAGADGVFYTADDACWWANAHCDAARVWRGPAPATRDPHPRLLRDRHR